MQFSTLPYISAWLVTKKISESMSLWACIERTLTVMVLVGGVNLAGLSNTGQGVKFGWCAPAGDGKRITREIIRHLIYDPINAD